jgi:hypothetical protein
MPNWCDNTFTVGGDPEKVAEFVEQMKGADNEALDFNKVIPLPEVLEDRSGINDIGWYNWSVTNWGTKWNVIEAQLGYNDGADSAVYYFQTAWSPPVPWFEVTVKYFPWLNFSIEWQEGGMGFGGELTASQGVLGAIDEWDVEWDENEEDYVRIAA